MRRLRQAVRRRPVLVLGMVFVVLQIVRALLADRTAPELTRGGREFSIGPFAPGAVLSQTFDVTSGALEAVRLAAEIDGDGALPSDAVDASLLEVYADGTERRVRGASLSLTETGDCCEARFPVVPYSARRRYRIELHVNAPEAARLALRARQARRGGGLVINGHPQPSNLVVATVGGDLGPLPGARRVALPLVLTAFAVFDAAWLAVLYALVTVPGRSVLVRHAT